MAMSLELRLVASSFPSSKPVSRIKSKPSRGLNTCLLIFAMRILEQLEQLLPYNIEPALLSNMHSLPNLIMPEKEAVN